MASWDVKIDFVQGTTTIGEETITVNTLGGVPGTNGTDGLDYASTQIENVVLLTANWTLVSGFYEYDYANVLILETSLVNIVPYNDTIDAVKDAYVMPMVVSAAGTVKIYAAVEPLGDMNVLIEVI